MASDNHTILVVDDLIDNSFMLQAFLTSEGYSVDVADSGRLALEKMHASPPDLVLLDVMMPQIDGYQLTRTIRHDDQLRSIPIVLITAHIEACRIKGLAAGATDFVRKPIDFGQLLMIIQQILRHQPPIKVAESQNIY